MDLRLVPDPHPVGSSVVMFPNVKGTVVAIRGEKREVRDEHGTLHVLGLQALVAAED